MVEHWIPKEECTGCGACSNVCPRGAISIVPDECGFLYPIIADTCINCKLCEKVCFNTRNNNNCREKKPATYAAWSKNNDIRFNSTSGGIFSELVQPCISEGAYIAGAAYNEKNLVEHILISDTEGLTKIRQSKYIQSNPLNIYREIKEKLISGSRVIFCGAPCQVAALYSFLGKDFDKLTTIDFICRGMNSPKAYLSWLREIEDKEKSRVKKVWFKYKTGGWKSSPKRTRIDFCDSHSIVLEGEDNLFMHGYLTSNLYIRPSCGQCRFKGVPRQADITLADFWGIEKILDDDKGTSMVLINSTKGENLLSRIKGNVYISERDFNEIFAGNVCFEESVKIPKESYDFLNELDNDKFSIVLSKYMKKYKPPFFQRLVFLLKRVIVKVLSSNPFID